MYHMHDKDDDLARQAKILEMQISVLLIGNEALRDEIERLQTDVLQAQRKRRFPKVMMSFITLMGTGKFGAMCEFL